MNKKNFIIVGGSIIGVLIAILVIIWIVTLVRPKYLTYDKVEEKIIEATNEYYKTNPDMLPIEDGKYNLVYSALVDNKLIKPLNELLKNGDECTVEIIVIKRGNDYSYIPKLNCKGAYETEELYKRILKDNQVVTENSGLYKSENNEYYFRGKISNNYVVFGKNGDNSKDELPIIWQIMSIGTDNTVKLKALSETKIKTKWDNRFNSTENSFVGYNDFDLSVLKDYLISLEKNEEFLKSNELSKVVKKQVCIGARSEKDSSKDGSAECSKLSKDFLAYSTLLPYEYMRASLDENCNNLANRACSNFNYLANTISDSEWSTTPYDENDYQIYEFDGYTYQPDSAKIKKNLNLVINLDEYTFYKSGTGTMEDPYIIR